MRPMKKITLFIASIIPSLDMDLYMRPIARQHAGQALAPGNHSSHSKPMELPQHVRGLVAAVLSV